MRRILLTGANSYIGTSFENFMKQWPGEYEINTLDMVNDTWRKASFECYDVILHVAGIAHRKETRKNKHLYYEVNRDLAIETAKKAQVSGVKQFIFLSTVNVYGTDTGKISKETQPAPNSHYGISKMQAETEIQKLSNENFKVAILRPPMVYGKNCKGNFRLLIKIAKHVNLFPKISNNRSMIYIENLSNFIKLLIDLEKKGVFFPQNKNYGCTSEIISIIGNCINKKIKVCSWLSPAVSVAKLCSRKARKAFGSLIYENLEEFNFSYCIVPEKQSFIQSV